MDYSRFSTTEIMTKLKKATEKYDKLVDKAKDSQEPENWEKQKQKDGPVENA